MAFHPTRETTRNEETMKIESLHRKIAKSAMHPKCPQAVKEAVQRISNRHATRQLHGNMANHSYKMGAE